MSATVILAIVAAVLVVLLVVAVVVVMTKQAGRPRMSKWERGAINRETNKYLEKVAAEAAFRTQAAAMGYDLDEAE